jgi:hypothetical protein
LPENQEFSKEAYSKNSQKLTLKQFRRLLFVVLAYARLEYERRETMRDEKQIISDLRSFRFREKHRARNEIKARGEE